MIYDALLWEKASCSKEDRKKIIPVIEILIKLADKASEEGLLALEENFNEIDSQFLKKGLQLVVDGTDPELVKNILMTLINAGGFSGVELLTRMMATDGILCIQNGLRPGFISDILCAYLGEDFESGLGKDADKTILNNDAISGTAQTTHVFENALSEDIEQGNFEPEDEPCSQKLMEILFANNRILYTEPVSRTEIEALSAAIESSEYGIRTFINIVISQPSVTTTRLLDGFKEFYPLIYNKIMEEWFVFDDLVMCDNMAIQKILREIDNQDLAKALKGASLAVQEKIFSNMSSRAATLLKEDMKYMGPVRIEDAEQSRSKIIGIARKLEEAGIIFIPRPENKRDHLGRTE